MLADFWSLPLPILGGIALGGVGLVVLIIALVQRLVRGAVRIARSLITTASVGLSSVVAMLPANVQGWASQVQAGWDAIAAVVPTGGAGVLFVFAVRSLIRRGVRGIRRGLVYAIGAVLVGALAVQAWSAWVG